MRFRDERVAVGDWSTVRQERTTGSPACAAVLTAATSCAEPASAKESERKRADAGRSNLSAVNCSDRRQTRQTPPRHGCSATDPYVAGAAQRPCERQARITRGSENRTEEAREAPSCPSSRGASCPVEIIHCAQREIRLKKDGKGKGEGREEVSGHVESLLKNSSSLLTCNGAPITR